LKVIGKALLWIGKALLIILLVVTSPLWIYALGFLGGAFGKGTSSTNGSAWHSGNHMTPHGSQPNNRWAS
jgi:hypothetical protein